MPTTTVLHYPFTGQSVPPDGTAYHVINEMDVFRTGGSITATAIPRQGSPEASKLYMEVIQTAVRQEPQTDAPSNYLLDIVVRNNSHASDPENSTITDYDLYVSVLNP